ncbi:tetratricopeptide repeat protein [Bacillus sp. DNRA2]|uniref:tetratricopeptide repeat protein n=1 Tax=Bacillus sp. DNRA2 TaxID=2723053 RepID=UPI00145D42B9|nr:tetratricopeptide repeat protein [Bacillus sp. DNRA2]NMD70326.1 tetratricopeptide repeat protein [Bacillus sp. DNRA2]
MDTVNKIISLLENGQQSEAIEKYGSILKNGTPEEKYDLAEELNRLGFLEESAGLYLNLLESYPDEGELLIELAEIHIETGQEEEAMLLLEKIDVDDDAYPQALLLLADLYQMNGLFEVSEQKLLTAKNLLPEEEIIDFALAELYGELGKFTDAIEAYERVSARGTKEIAGIQIHQRLAEMLSAIGLFEEAIPHYELALHDKLEINTLFGFALTAYQADSNKLAIEKFEQLRGLDPEYHSLYLMLAKAYEREGELNKSFEAIKQGLRVDEYNKDLFYFGGKLALKLDEQTEAEELIRNAIALDPGFTEAVLTLNKLLLIEERFEEVLELASVTEANHEVEPQLLWDEAVAYQHLEQYPDALNKYQLAYTYFKEDKEFLKDYGYFLIEEGKSAKAVEIFSELLKFDPTNTEYLELIERFTNL